MDYKKDSPPILLEFLRYHENIMGQSSKTVSEYYLDLRLFLRFMKLYKSERPVSAEIINNTDISELDLDFIKTISLSDVYEYFDFLHHDREYHTETNHPGQGLENAARARKLSSIKAFYKYLTVRTKQLTENPVKDMEFPKQRRALPKYLTLEQATELLTSVEGRYAKRDLAILMIFLNCGVRISELAGLNLGDIHNDRLRVLGKGNKERTVYMGDGCIAAIERYNETLSEDIRNDVRRPLFLSQKGGRMSTNAVHRLVKKHLTAAGLDATQYSAHKLRHTAATMMLSRGVDVKTVQEVLGHEHLNTTEIYTHIESTELKIAADANPISRFIPTDEK